jgi:hypothetical protein
MPQAVIVSPALRDANNGNWQTARRWQTHLMRGHDVMITLHAGRSADAIAAWGEAHHGHRLAVVLTGTDLYRDFETDVSAQVLVVLQDSAPRPLIAGQRAKCRVIYQSTSVRKPLLKSPNRLRAVMVGHLCDDRPPRRYSLPRDCRRRGATSTSITSVKRSIPHWPIRRA